MRRSGVEVRVFSHVFGKTAMHSSPNVKMASVIHIEYGFGLRSRFSVKQEQKISRKMQQISSEAVQEYVGALWEAWHSAIALAEVVERAHAAFNRAGPLRYMSSFILYGCDLWIQRKKLPQTTSFTVKIQCVMFLSALQICAASCCGIHAKFVQSASGF